MSDIGARLARALATAAATAGCPVDVVRSGWQRWASATFTGARHQLVLQAPPSDALDAWLGTLGEAEIALPGHLVADLHLDHVARGAERVEATLAVLTVETV